MCYTCWIIMGMTSLAIIINYYRDLVCVCKHKVASSY